MAAETTSCQYRFKVNAAQDQTLVGRDLLPCVFHPKILLIKNILVKRGIRSPEVTITQVAGRLALFRDNWERVTQDQWVLDAVTGYRIEFLSPPTQNEQPQGGRMLLGRAVPHKRGDQQNAIQRGDNKANPRGSKPRVLLEPVPSPKEGTGV